MSGTKKKGADAVVETAAIRALRPLDVDGVRIEEGATAEIRAELVTVLVDIGAAEVVAPKTEA